MKKGVKYVTEAQRKRIRSLRVSDETWGSFQKWCKAKGLSQSQGLRSAMVLSQENLLEMLLDSPENRAQAYHILLKR